MKSFRNGRGINPSEIHIEAKHEIISQFNALTIVRNSPIHKNYETNEAMMSMKIATK
jgi:hypothetical protein